MAEKNIVGKLTELEKVNAYEVSLVPFGVNEKKKFLITKNGETTVSNILTQILKSNFKDTEKLTEIAKSKGLDEKATNGLVAILKIAGAEDIGLDQGKVIDVLKSLSGEKSIDELKNELTIEIKKELKIDSSEPNGTHINKNNHDNGGNLMNGVPVLKSNGEWDLTKVDENLKGVLGPILKQNEKFAQDNKNLSEKLQASEDARVLKGFEDKAKEYGHVAEDATKLASVLKSIHDANPENAEAIEAVLKSANKKIDEAKVFEEVGSNKASEMGSSAWAQIEKSAEQLQKNKPELTQAQAQDLVLKNNPKLYADYLEEKEGK